MEIYDFHDVTIVFVSPTVTSKFYCYIIFWEHMCTSRELLGRMYEMYAATQKKGAEVHISHFLVIVGEQKQNVHFVEQMQNVYFFMFSDWSIGQYRKI